MTTDQDGTIEGRVNYPCPEVVSYSPVYFSQPVLPTRPELPVSPSPAPQAKWFPRRMRSSLVPMTRSPSEIEYFSPKYLSISTRRGFDSLLMHSMFCGRSAGLFCTRRWWRDGWRRREGPKKRRESHRRLSSVHSFTGQPVNFAHSR